jgi:hypothetical protein
MREWTPVAVDEYGYAAPDPLNADIVYGGRSVTRFDRNIGTVSVIGPLAGRTFAPGQSPYRQVRTQPVVFSKADPKLLFFANNVLWKTTDGGLTWQQLSPDLTRQTWTIPASVGKYTNPTLVQQRGVIYTIGPSPTDPNVIWIGTDDGIVQHTIDGGQHWTNVTPRQLGPWWKLFMIDAGHFDTQTAYAAVNTLRLDDMRPHFYRTHDGGRTWTDIAQNFSAKGARVTDLASLGPANAVREDPKKKGLLYAATEKGVWVSFDDGDSWQSLQINLPATSVRDLIVKDDDIAIATHGRGFWILDDITALRQITPDLTTRDATLFAPATALRVRWNTNDDTPLPPDEPMGENPPEGGSIDYYLNSARSDVVSLDIVDARNRVVRRYSSADSLPWRIPTNANAPVPLYWYRTPSTLQAGPGVHRFQWDVRYQPIPGVGDRRDVEGLPMTATPYNTAPSARTPFVAPGNYTVRLTVGGKTYTQPITVRQDPRVTLPEAALREVYALTDSMYWSLARLQESMGQARTLRQSLTDSTRLATLASVFDAPAPPDTSIRGAPPAARPVVAAAARSGIGNQPTPAPTTLSGASNALAALLNSLQSADVPVTATQRAGIEAALRNASTALARWGEFPH